MDGYPDIDLDSESIWLDGAWHTRDALGRKIKELVAAGDYRLSRLTTALERLDGVLGKARALTVRMPGELADALGQASAAFGRPVGHLVREAIAYYLAAAAAHAAAQSGQAAPAAPDEPGKPR
jgi:hypothetical protein